MKVSSTEIMFYDKATGMAINEFTRPSMCFEPVGTIKAVLADGSKYAVSLPLKTKEIQIFYKKKFKDVIFMRPRPYSTRIVFDLDSVKDQLDIAFTMWKAQL